MQVYSLKHDITDVQCLMPGLILAIRRVVRLKVSNKSHQVFISKFLEKSALIYIKLKTTVFPLLSFTAEPGVWIGEIFVELPVHSDQTPSCGTVLPIIDPMEEPFLSCK